MKRALIAMAVATSFFATNLLAAEATGTLAPGKPSGVKKAQDWDMQTLGIFGGLALAGILVGLSTGQSNKSQPVNATTTPTPVSTAT
jgi:hypothetical protein